MRRRASSGSGFLQQNAFHKDDTYVPLDKQMWMMEAILHLYQTAPWQLVAAQVPFSVSAMAEAGLFDKLVKDKVRDSRTTSRKCSASTTKELDDMCAASCLQTHDPCGGLNGKERLHMAMEYFGVKDINGSLIVAVDGVQGRRL